MDYPMMKIRARDIATSDWVEDEGPVIEVAHYSTLTYLRCSDQGKLIPAFSTVWVRIEDHGQTE